MRKEASETVHSLLRKRLVSRITKVYLRKTSEETLLYWWVNQRHPSDINSFFGPHQRGMSIGRASDWHVRNTWIDDPHRRSLLYNHMQKKTLFNHCIDKRKASNVISSPFHHWGCSSEGRALALHVSGTGIASPHLQFFQRSPEIKKKEIREAVLLDQNKTWICTSNMQKEASETVQSLLRKH